MLYKYGDYLCVAIFIRCRIECWTNWQAGRQRARAYNKKESKRTTQQHSFYRSVVHTQYFIPLMHSRMFNLPRTSYNIRCAFIFFTKFNAICFIFHRSFDIFCVSFFSSRFSVYPLSMYKSILSFCCPSLRLHHFCCFAFQFFLHIILYAIHYPSVCVHFCLFLSLYVYDFVVIEIRHTYISLSVVDARSFFIEWMFASHSSNLPIPLALFILLLLLSFRLNAVFVNVLYSISVFGWYKNALHFVSFRFSFVRDMGPAVSLLSYVLLLIVIIRLFFHLRTNSSVFMVSFVNAFFYLIFFPLLFLMLWLRRAVYKCICSVARDQIHNNRVFAV